MSYCVNCGVELGAGAGRCPLCHTPVQNPHAVPDKDAQPFFPTRHEGVEPVSRRMAGLLLSSMLASVALCCGILNLLFYRELWWSFFPGGAAVMLWVWFAMPLLFRRLSAWCRLTLDTLAIGVYVLLIALAVHGLDWYLRLAVPMLLCAVCVCPTVIWVVRYHRLSILSSAILVLLTAGFLAAAVELFCDLYLRGVWRPGWSLIVLISCVGLCIPLIVIRRVPYLREEARRRFHV